MRLQLAVEKSLLSIREKVKGETNIGVFTKEEREIMEEGFFNIVGRTAPKNCNGLCPSVIKNIRNWYAWYEKEVEAKSILASALNPTTAKTEEKAADIPEAPQGPEEVDLSKLKLKELRSMFPGIKASSKKEFIEKIEAGE